MATSLFFMPTDENSSGNPNELLMRNTYLVNPSGEIRTEPPQKSRGRKPGSKTGTQKQKKQTLRGMGVARLERLRIEEEKKNNMVLAQGGGDTLAASPKVTRSPDPGVVLQGFPSYGTGGHNISVGGYTRSSRFLCGGFGSGQIPPWETYTHEPSSFPNPQMYNPSNNHCDTCFKKQRINEDQNDVVRSNGGEFSKYKIVPHLLPQDQRSQGFFYDHRLARYSAPPSASTNQVLNEVINTSASTNQVLNEGLIEELDSGNPINGTGDLKEYEFFPGNYGNKSVSSVATSVGDCSSNTPTIDLSLKL